jgi:hypothetical protein
MSGQACQALHINVLALPSNIRGVCHIYMYNVCTLYVHLFPNMKKRRHKYTTQRASSSRPVAIATVYVRSCVATVTVYSWLPWLLCTNTATITGAFQNHYLATGERSAITVWARRTSCLFVCSVNLVTYYTNVSRQLSGY